MRRRDFLGALSAGVAAGAAPRRPNVVLIYCDDLGYGDLGCYGSPLRTPNLDRMAREGMRFTNFYSANALCSPSRAALLTGRYSTRVGVPRVLNPNDTEGLARDEQTMGDVLGAAGYKTACVGKWHLGHRPAYLPTERGFGSYFGIPYSNDMNPRVLMRGTEVIEPEAKLETLTGRYTEEAKRFIEDNARQPFFLYLAHTYPHVPLAASEKFRNRSRFGLYGDVIEELDAATGDLLAKLKALGLERDTVVLFSSDNGPWWQGSPGPFRSRKGSTWEGGLRVPLLARWPGQIPAGRTVDAPACTLDLLPTILGWTGAKGPSKPLDGTDMSAVFRGGTSPERDILLFFAGYDLQCARWKDWKLHITRYNTAAFSPAPAGGIRNFHLRKPELYDVAHDLSESYDVAAQHPEVVSEMMQRVERLLPGFPEPVQSAWKAASQTREISPGAFPGPER